MLSGRTAKTSGHSPRSMNVLDWLTRLSDEAAGAPLSGVVAGAAGKHTDIAVRLIYGPGARLVFAS
jgi:hypothetical protein